jgi:hypothetical protein
MSETLEEMNRRLCGVIARARFTVLAEPHAWQPLARSAPLPANAIAVVRDGESWAALVPTTADAAGAYRIFAFHFAEGTNASGFVAWLAGLMKSEAGTGAMVVCGFDARATAALWQTSLPVGQGRRGDHADRTATGRKSRLTQQQRTRFELRQIAELSLSFDPETARVHFATNRSNSFNGHLTHTGYRFDAGVDFTAGRLADVPSLVRAG